jgi:hypothetical protein
MALKRVQCYLGTQALSSFVVVLIVVDMRPHEKADDRDNEQCPDSHPDSDPE